MAIKEVKVQAGYFDWREATDAEGNHEYFLSLKNLSAPSRRNVAAST